MNYEYAGIISAGISTCVFFPIDQIKVKYQVQNKLTLHEFTKGFKGGIRYDLSGALLSGFIYWKTFDFCKQNNYDTNTAILSAVTLSNIVDTPFDWMKRQRQVINIAKDFSKPRYFTYSCINSYIYNMIYVNIMKKSDTQSTPWLMFSSMCASCFSYPFDYLRTRVISANSIQSIKQPTHHLMKGLITKMCYSTMYSTLYMSIFLYLTKKKLE